MLTAWEGAGGRKGFYFKKERGLGGNGSRGFVNGREAEWEKALRYITHRYTLPMMNVIIIYGKPVLIKINKYILKTETAKALSRAADQFYIAIVSIRMVQFLH